MTRTRLFFFALFLSVSLLQISEAQVETIISPVEAEMTDVSVKETEGIEKEKLIDEVCEEFEGKHKDEDVINLVYNRSIEVKEDWSYTEKVYCKKKILNQAGKRYGEIPVTYEKGRDEVVNISAYTTTPDGEKYRYTRIHDVRIYAGYRSYSDYRRKIITMPQINVGSIIEYEKEIRSKGKPIKGEYWETLYLAFGIPTLVSDISISFPKSLKINYKAFKLDQEAKITETEDRITYSWHFVDAHYDEKIEEYEPYPKVEDMENIAEFSSMKNWSDISDWYNAVVAENSLVTKEIEDAAASIFEGKKSTRDKARALARYMIDNFRYVSMAYENNKLEPHKTDEVFRNKYGDCKDIAVFCKVLLDIGGIDSNVVLFNDEEDITEPQYDLPDPGLFDHALLLIHDPEGDFYLDPFLEGYDIGEYPSSYEAGYCFVINGNGGYFDRLPVFDEARNYEYTKSFIEINDDGSALFTVESLWGLDFSINSRLVRAEMNDEVKERFFEYLDSLYEEVFERKWENSELDKYGRIKSYLKYVKKNVFVDSGGVIIIDIGAFGNAATNFTNEKRNAPIFFAYNSLDEKMTTYKIPKGYKIEHVPSDIDLDIKFFRLKREYKVKGREITARERRWTKRMELPASEYSKVKEFSDSIGEKTKQRIVLKKYTPWWRKIGNLLSKK